MATKGKKYDSATLINKDVDKRIDRGLKAAALDVENKKNRALFKKIIGRRKSSAQDPSEVKTKRSMVSKAYKKAASTAKRVSDAYKKAKKFDPSGRITSQDLSRGMMSKKAKRK
jgi:hypothetical protein